NSAADFTAYLERLGYRQRSRVAGPGEYRPVTGGVELHTRGLEFWDGQEQDLHFTVRFDGGQVIALDAAPGTSTAAGLALVRLEPVEIAQINPETGEDRIPVTFEEIPPELLQAIVSVEDHRFYEHFGVDIRG